MNEDQLKAELKDLSGELTTLSTKGATCSPEEFERFKVIGPRIKDIRDKIDTAAAMKAAQGDNLEYLKKAVATLEQPAGVPEVPGLVAVTPAGHEVVDRATKRILDTHGAAMGPVAYKAIKTTEYGSAIESFIRKKGDRNVTAKEYKTLQEGLDTEGGYLLPEDFLAQLISKKPTPTRVADYCTQMSTSVDRKVIPKVIWTADDIYTTGIRVAWVGENPGSATAARATDPVFGVVSIPVYTAMVSIPITKDMLEDSAVDIQQYLIDKFRETYDLVRDNMVLNGSGNNQPTGILTNVGGVSPAPVGPAYVPTGNATALSGDGFIKLGFSLPEQYDVNARMIANKTNTGAAMATLKDGTGRYLWGYGMQDSGLAPGGLGSGARMMCGYPVVWSGFMPNVAANAYPVLFGDLSGYYLVNRVGLSIQILNELYAEQNYIVILGRLRFGGQVAEEWKLKALKVSTT